MPRQARAKHEPTGPAPAPGTPPPGDEQLTQLVAAFQRLPRQAIAISRIAAERGAGTLAAKAASTEREMERAVRAGAPKDKVERLRARAATYGARAARGDDQVQMARRLQKIAAAFGQRPAAFGRAVDEQGRGHPDLPVALVTERGETLATSHTDDEGFFALSQSAPVNGTDDVLLQVGKNAALGTFPVTSRGRLLPPRAIVARGPRGGGRTRKVSKKGR